MPGYRYSPLDMGANEIRLLRVKKPKFNLFGDNILDCELVHVSLDDYTLQYAEFMELDGTERSAWDRATLWDYITAREETRDALRSSEPPIRGLTTFTDKAAYHVPGKYTKDTARWVWGDFYALSYEWGDPKVTRPITVNGKEVQVRENLRNALRQFYYIEQFQKGMYGRLHIWVDALCIDQSNVDERNVQVKRMKTIYSEARLVLLWTGLELRHGNRLMKLISGMRTDSPDGGLEIRKNDAKAILELASRSYWGRLWVIQEMLLANAGACICFGNQSCSLDIWFFVILIFRTQSVSIIQDSGPKRIYGLATNERLSTLSHFRVLGLPRPDLAVVMHSSRYAKQENPRDKVYAMLGLMHPALQDLVRPDYNATVLEVYRQFVRSTIQFTSQLEMIYQGSSMTSRNSAFPSWVPDWTLAPADEEFPSFTGKANGAEKFHAASETGHVYLVEKEECDPNHLTCRGFRVDFVDGLSCSASFYGQHTTHDCVPATSDEAAYASTSAFGGDEAVRGALLETLNIGLVTKMGPDMADLLRALLWFDGNAGERRLWHNGKPLNWPWLYEAIGRFERCNGAMAIAGKPMASYFPSRFTSDCVISPAAEMGTDFGGLLNHPISVMNTRRLATTIRGYLSMVPKLAQAGDQIFVLLGCDVPLVLRPSPSDSTYRLIGECYIHGMMKGEAMGWLETGRCKLETVVLS